jgi:hypothetical protein
MPTYPDAAEFFARERSAWTEKHFQSEVIRLAGECGWTHIYHTYFSKRSETGFPDLFMGHRSGRIVVAELKAQKGRVSPQQQDWLDFFDRHQLDIANTLERAELSGRTRVTDVQQALLRRDAELRAMRIFGVYLWRPCCWNSGEIERVLRGVHA